jgi:hypothetical protein
MPKREMHPPASLSPADPQEKLARLRFTDADRAPLRVEGPYPVEKCAAMGLEWAVELLKQRKQHRRRDHSVDKNGWCQKCQLVHADEGKAPD